MAPRVAWLWDRLGTRPWIWVLYLFLAAVGIVGFFMLNRRSSERFLEEAAVAFAEHDVDRAGALLLEAEKSRSNDPRLLLLLGRVARLEQRFEKAVQYLYHAEAAGGPTEDIAAERLLLRAQQGNLTAGEYQRLVQAALEGAAPSLQFEALLHGALKRLRYNDARFLGENWTRRQPENDWAWFLFGRTLEQVQDFAPALAAFDRSIELKPSKPAYRLARAKVLLQLRRYPDALRDYEFLLALEPDHLSYRLGCGQALVALGRLDDADGHVRALLAKLSTNADVLYLKGQMEYQALRFDAAEPFLRRAYEAAPFRYEILVALTNCLERLNRKEEAAQARTKMQRLGDALTRLIELRKEITADPNNLAFRVEAGGLYLSMDNDAEGLEILYGILLNNPGHVPAHRLLSEHFTRKGDRDKAQHHLDVLAKTPPL